ncbi:MULTISPECIES: MlaD family protein [unclassified Mycobacterium]|uniref:MlaD family protein n=1 Tax=unclassified Mycobacterium TaxID=2642494 RepID=UPI00048DEBF7|nr:MULTISPECIES: MlaD family protein [unclassified Mycobacterium]SEA31274.1 phospholipid/cholesterol/gamma-HCH transport system substrate-binding protein [Mycobacterium sp. 283mftsu]
MSRPVVSLVAAVACTAVAYVLIVNGLRNPVAGTTYDCHALFADASGVRTGADVRRQGVQVGKVTSVQIRRAGDTNVADVGLSLARTVKLTTAAHLSVKFQNLTGSRYIDIRDDPTSNPRPISDVPLTQTSGSFDITAIFSGLAPVLKTVEPSDINDLTEKLSVFLEGDGAGASDLLNSIQVIAGRAADRQRTISTLIDNISTFAARVQGNSGRVMHITALLDHVVAETLKVREQFGLSAQYGPNFTAAVNRLLWVVGLREGTDVNAKLDVLRANLYRVPEFFERLPGFYNGVQPFMKDPRTDLHCTNGTLVVPPTVKVLLAGQQVTLCNR